jgi:hypothetical protein
MTRDERMYPKPELFNPDRFMNQDKTEADLTEPKDFIFGFGRRQVIITRGRFKSSPFTIIHHHFRECPGKVFADANVWLVSACIIAAFQAPVSLDELGKKVVPPAQFTSGFVRYVQAISLTL